MPTVVHDGYLRKILGKDGGEGLTVSAELFILLLAFVVEDDDLRAAAFFNHLANHVGVGLRAELALFARHGDDWELDLAVGACA